MKTDEFIRTAKSCSNCLFQDYCFTEEPCLSCNWGNDGDHDQWLPKDHPGFSLVNPVPENDGTTVIQIDPEIEEQCLSETETASQQDLGGIKDSGSRTEFDTGAVRDGRTGKGRFDLLPLLAMWRLAKWYEKGCLKYGDRNWEKGIPISKYIDSALRHLIKFICGFKDEPHLTAARWNLAGASDTLDRIKLGLLPESLNDLPYTFKDLDIEQIENLLEEML